MKFVKRVCALCLTLTMVGSLAACGSPSVPSGGSTPPSGAPTPGTVLQPGETAPPLVTETPPVPTPTTAPAPTADASYEAVLNYWSDAQLTQEWGPNQVVEHLFFHPVIAYPTFAFTSTSNKEAAGLDDWMVTVGEFNEIIQNVYDKGFILVRMEDVWSEVIGDDGAHHMVRNTLRLPEGKKPLVISFDDVNYYQYMLTEGFMAKLILGDDGQIWAEGLNPLTKETVITQDLDATTLLDKFVLAHPDFSLNGAKAIFSLTGYQGILGYRTQNDIDISSSSPDRPAFEAMRQAEIDAVKPIIEQLKATGWTFGSHTWGHINLGKKSLNVIKTDTERWASEVGSLVGPTSILFYPHGARPDNGDQGAAGPMFQYLHDQGFRVFASVGINSYSKIKSDLSAVICDRLHPDGTTLRWNRDRYLQFYDAWEIIDLEVRPALPYDRKPAK